MSSDDSLSPLSHESQVLSSKVTLSQNNQPTIENEHSKTECQSKSMSLGGASTSQRIPPIKIMRLSTNEWQTVKISKRPRQSNPNSPEAVLAKKRHPTLTLTNQFDKLTDDEQDETSNKTDPKPPPIFIPGVTNITKLQEDLGSLQLTGETTYKAINKNQIRINAGSIESYRAIIKLLSTRGAEYHTYQLKQERAFRVVIRNLHPTAQIENIKNEIQELGFSVRNISNIRHRATKEPMPLFFVDLEPNALNQEIYKLRRLLGAQIIVEAPKKQQHIVQCLRCQRYGHTKKYCNRGYRCVKCGEEHDSIKCVKTKETPATCVLCGGEHPANYKGCAVYKEIKQRKINLSPNQIHPIQATQVNPMLISQHANPAQSTSPNIPRKSYAQAVHNNEEDKPKSDQILSTISETFAKLEALLIKQGEQLTSLIALLTTVVSKLA